MSFKRFGAVISVAASLGLASFSAAEARSWCRGAPAGWCGPQPVSHFIYYPRYSNVYYWATLAPYPGAYAYMPRGYVDRYSRPYSRYARRFWQPRRVRAPVVAYPVAAQAPGCCDDGYLK